MSRKMSEKELEIINEAVQNASTHLESNAKYRADHSFNDYNVKIYTISTQNTIRVDIQKRTM